MEVPLFAVSPPESHQTTWNDTSNHSVGIHHFRGYSLAFLDGHVELVRFESPKFIRYGQSGWFGPPNASKVGSPIGADALGAKSMKRL